MININPRITDIQFRLFISPTYFSMRISVDATSELFYQDIAYIPENLMKYYKGSNIIRSDNFNCYELSDSGMMNLELKSSGSIYSTKNSKSVSGYFVKAIFIDKNEM